MIKPVKSLLKKAYYSQRFNKTAVKLYARIRPLPYQRPNMEFDFDVWNGICTFHAHDGRQIGENNTNPAIYKEVMETESRICKFEGRRNGLPINVTALKQVMAVWNDALQFVTLLRNDYIRRRGLEAQDGHINLVQGYVFSKLGAAYASYLARKRDNPITSLPPLETAFFTLGVGPFMVVRAYMEKGDLAVLSPEFFSGPVLYQMADDAGTLVSAGSGFGCAGSKKLITDFVDVTMNGTYKGELTSKEALRALNAIGDWDEFYRYVYASSRLELLVKLNQYLCAQALHALKSRPEGLSEAERDLVQQSLDASYHQPIEPLDERMVMANFIQIVLVLLDEFDYPAAKKALAAAQLINADGTARPLPELSGTELHHAAAQRIRQSCELLLPLCQQELAALHQALHRFESHTITLADVYRRCGGEGMQTLVTMLQASAGQAQAAISGEAISA